MSEIYSYKAFNLKITDVDKSSRIIKGRFAAFGVIDSDGDMIMPGSFAKTIKEKGPKSAYPRIKHMIDHNISQTAAVIKELDEVSEGLDYVSHAGTHFWGEELIKMAESGIITEHSIGFETIKQQKRAGYNEMTELNLWEGSSLRAWGANQFTPLKGRKMRHRTIEELTDRVKALDSFCRKSDARDETIELLLIEQKQLSQLIIDILSEKSTQPDDESTEPEEQDYSKIVMSLDELHKTLKTNHGK